MDDAAGFETIYDSAPTPYDGKALNGRLEGLMPARILAWTELFRQLGMDRTNRKSWQKRGIPVAHAPRIRRVCEELETIPADQRQGRGVVEGAILMALQVPKSVPTGKLAAADTAEPQQQVLMPRQARRSSMSIEEFLSIPPREWILEGLIHTGSFTVVTGAPKSGKSAIMTSMAFLLALEQPLIHGHKAASQRVIYLVLEGAQDARGHIQGMKQRYGTTANFRCWTHPVNLIDLSGRDAGDLISDILEHKITLVVLDTVARATPGGEENTSAMMGALVLTIDRIIRETGAAVVAILHDRKAGHGTSDLESADSLRGHGSFRAAADTIVRVARDRSGVRTVKVIESRSMEAGQWAAFRIDGVVIGRDADGDEMTAVAVEEAEWPAGKRLALTTAPASKGKEGMSAPTADHSQWVSQVRRAKSALY